MMINHKNQNIYELFVKREFLETNTAFLCLTGENTLADRHTDDLKVGLLNGRWQMTLWYATYAIQKNIFKCTWTTSAHVEMP